MSVQQTSPDAPILCVAGARPNFMKIAPIISVLRDKPNSISIKLVHTGQHYDPAMNSTFFDQLQIPAPDIELEVGSASHAVQTAEIMRRFEPEVDRLGAGAVLVVGDVMLDEYLWGDVERVSPEAPVPVVHVQRESLALGGAGNVVRNIVAMGAECVVCAVVGNDQGDPAEVSRRHSRCRTPMMVAHRLETSREIPRGNRGGLTLVKARTVPPAEWQG